jgi:hypothetical protein
MIKKFQKKYFLFYLNKSSVFLNMSIIGCFMTINEKEAIILVAFQSLSIRISRYKIIKISFVPKASKKSRDMI